MKDDKSELGARVGNSFGASLQVLQMALELLVTRPSSMEIGLARGGSAMNMLLVNVFEHSIEASDRLLQLHPCGGRRVESVLKGVSLNSVGECYG